MRVLLSFGIAALVACGGSDGSDTSPDAAADGGGTDGGTGDDGATGDGGGGDSGTDSGPAPPVTPGADPAFGSGGLVTVNFTGGISGLFAAARQTDGAVVGVGGTQETIVVVRVKPDGTFDPAFGKGGAVHVPSGYPANGVTIGYGVVVQPDQKILVATRMLAAFGTLGNQEILFRLMPDGSLDPSFASKGYSLGDPKQPVSYASSVALQSNGGIIVGGAGRVERRTPDGAFDPAFGTGGVANAQSMDIFALAVQPDDKIVAAGGMKLARFTTTGAVDATFTAPDAPGQQTGTTGYFSLALQPDGKVLAGGALTLGSDTTASLVVGRYGTDGALDTSFGNAGWASNSDPKSGGLRAMGAAVLPDGKIVACGQASGNGKSVRFTPSGQLDTTFGSGGVGTVFPSPLYFDPFGGLALDPSGAFTAVGATVDAKASSFDVAFARTTAAGAPDTAFAGSGLTSLRVGGSFDRALAMVVEPDGKILVGGNVQGGAPGLVRLGANGSLDTTFGKAGIVYGTRLSINEVSSLALLPSGKILVSGNSANNALSSSTFAVARLDAAGALDPSFGTAGIGGGAVVTGQEAVSGAMAVTPSGAIVVVGTTRVTNGVQIGLMRLTADGQLDSAFGTNGTAVTSITGWSVAQPSQIALQPDGKILVVAASATDGTGALLRFTDAGALDASFGNAGQVKLAKMGYALGLQSDGKIVVVSGDHVAGTVDVARYEAAGAPDPAFGAGGTTSAKIGGSDYFFSPLNVQMGLLLQPDGKILVGAAGSSDGLVESATLLRLGADGAPDASFAPGGVKTLQLGRGSSTIHALATQPDGKLLVAGRVWTESGSSDFSVLRLLP